MRAVIRTLCLAIASVAVFSSCNKDDDKSSSKTKLLTSGTWKIILAEEKENGGAWEDVTDIQFAPCTQDDRLKFSEPNVITSDEGATKCDPSDPQTQTGTWAFVSNGQGIDLDGELYDIDELNGHTFKISYTETFGGESYSYRLTFVH